MEKVSAENVDIPRELPESMDAVEELFAAAIACVVLPGAKMAVDGYYRGHARLGDVILHAITFCKRNNLQLLMGVDPHAMKRLPFECQLVPAWTAARLPLVGGHAWGETLQDAIIVACVQAHQRFKLIEEANVTVKQPAVIVTP